MKVVVKGNTFSMWHMRGAGIKTGVAGGSVNNVCVQAFMETPLRAK